MLQTRGAVATVGALFLLFACAQSAIGATLSVGTAEVHPKDAGIEVAMTFAAGQDEHVSGVQFDLLCSESVAALSSMRAGPAAVAAEKSVSFNRIAAGRYRAIVAGLNQNVIGDGVLVVLVFDVSVAPPDGPQPLDLDDIVMSDPNGFSVPATGTPGVLDVIGGVTDGGNCPNCGCACGAFHQDPRGSRGNVFVCLVVLTVTAARTVAARRRRRSTHER